MPQNTTDQFLQQHISYNFYLQKCLAYQAATALTNKQLCPFHPLGGSSGAVALSPEVGGGGGTQPCLPAASLVVGSHSPPAVPPAPEG